MSFYVEERDNGITWVKFEWDSPEDLRSIAKWCNEHQCGKQVNIRAFSFKNKDELTMFLLRWQA